MSVPPGLPKPKSMRLKNLYDVAADSPGDNYFLLYDASLGKWVPRPITSAAIPNGAISNDHLAGGITDDKLVADYALDAELGAHLADTDNPHGVTIAQIGAAADDHSHPDATPTASGFMSAVEHTKLAGLGIGGSPQIGGSGGAHTFQTSLTQISGFTVNVAEAGWHWLRLNLSLFIDKADGVVTIHVYKNGSSLYAWTVDLNSDASAAAIRFPFDVSQPFEFVDGDQLTVWALKTSGSGTSEMSGQGSLVIFRLP